MWDEKSIYGLSIVYDHKKHICGALGAGAPSPSVSLFRWDGCRIISGKLYVLMHFAC